MSITPSDGARLAGWAESMYDRPENLTPDLPDPNWTLLAHLTAANALFGAQVLGIGERVFFGFLAQSKTDEREWAVVYRGTEAPIEWLENAHALLYPRVPDGWVEHGFYSIYRSSEVLGHPGTPAAAALNAMLPADANVTVIGHSLGAALATYLCLDLARMRPGVRGLFYASPRPGDAAFGDTFDKAVGRENYECFNYFRDIVPHLPPALPGNLGFQHLPGARWIKPSESTFKVPDGVVNAHAAWNYAQLIDGLKAAA